MCKLQHVQYNATPEAERGKLDNIVHRTFSQAKVKKWPLTHVYSVPVYVTDQICGTKKCLWLVGLSSGSLPLHALLYNLHMRKGGDEARCMCVTQTMHSTLDCIGQNAELMTLLYIHCTCTCIMYNHAVLHCCTAYMYVQWFCWKYMYMYNIH